SVWLGGWSCALPEGSSWSCRDQRGCVAQQRSPGSSAGVLKVRDYGDTDSCCGAKTELDVLADTGYVDDAGLGISFFHLQPRADGDADSVEVAQDGRGTVRHPGDSYYLAHLGLRQHTAPHGHQTHV